MFGFFELNPCRQPDDKAAKPGIDKVAAVVPKAFKNSRRLISAIKDLTFQKTHSEII